MINYDALSNAPDKFSFKNFTDWVRTKPPTETYFYVDNRNCPFAQFLKALGYPEAWVDPVAFTISEGTYRLPNGVDYAVSRRPPCGESRTFGALLQCLEKAQS